MYSSYYTIIDVMHLPMTIFILLWSFDSF